MSNLARLVAGRPAPLLGRLLSDRRDDELILLDPESGAELAADAMPAFVLSTEREATDGIILRQSWDLSRAEVAGVPVLWNHDPDRLLGQWRDLRVSDLGDGPVLLGRADLDLGLPEAVDRRRQIRQGYLSAVSVRWIPGDLVRRGDLDPADPLYREPEQDLCDQPAEGYVSGSPARPNTLVETSLTPIPADQRAVVTERTHQRAASDLSAALRGDAVDLSRLLTVLSDDPRVRQWAARVIRAELARLTSTPINDLGARLQRLLSPSQGEPSHSPRLADLLRSNRV
jgi:phage head maturation protease